MTVSWFMVHAFEICANLEVEFFSPPQVLVVEEGKKCNQRRGDMEEWCAVCAEPLEWVAYGPCGHREVCFTCTARLRFVLEDKRCCICKQDCPCVFVTKVVFLFSPIPISVLALMHFCTRKYLS
jgi:hypothetical protein